MDQLRSGNGVASCLYRAYNEKSQEAIIEDLILQCIVKYFSTKAAPEEPENSAAYFSCS